MNDITINTLKDQLYLDDVIQFDEYNNRLKVDPNYTTIVHAAKQRILVILPTFRDFTNRETADIVLFFSQGMVYVEKNKYGPPGLTLPISRVTAYELLRNVSSPWVAKYPDNGSCEPMHKPGIGGIFAIESRDQSGAHEPNCDNMYNNEDFLKRK